MATQGQTVRPRFMNEGQTIHPTRLHGMHMTVIARDGSDVSASDRCDTIHVAPGERWDAPVRATNPGMFGMVTALVVQG